MRHLNRQMRVLARSLLDGYPAEQLQTRFPNIAPLLDYVATQYDEKGRERSRRGWPSPMPLRCNWVGGYSSRCCAWRPVSRSCPTPNCAKRYSPSAPG